MEYYNMSTCMILPGHKDCHTNLSGRLLTLPAYVGYQGICTHGGGILNRVISKYSIGYWDYLG